MKFELERQFIVYDLGVSYQPPVVLYRDNKPAVQGERRFVLNLIWFSIALVTKRKTL